MQKVPCLHKYIIEIRIISNSRAVIGYRSFNSFKVILKPSLNNGIYQVKRMGLTLLVPPLHCLGDVLGIQCISNQQE